MPPVGKLQVRLEADTVPFAAGMNKAMASLRAFNGLVRSVAVGAIGAMVKSTLNWADGLADAALQAGVSVKWLQAMGYAAKQSGSSAERLADSLTELSRSAVQASEGSKESRQAFEELGLTGRDLATLNLEQVFERIALTIQASGGEAKKTAAAITLLGRAGKSLLPMMQSDFKKLQSQAERLGIVLDEGAVDALGDMNDELDSWLMRLKAGLAQILRYLAPVKELGTVFRGFFEAGKTLARGQGFGAAKNTLDTYYDMAADGILKDVEESKARVAARKRTLQRPVTDQPTGGGDWSPDESKGGHASIQAANSLARIGAYGSGGPGMPNPLVHTQNQALATLNKMHAVLQKMANRKPSENPLADVTW